MLSIRLWVACPYFLLWIIWLNVRFQLSNPEFHFDYLQNKKKDGPSSRLVILRAAGSGYFPVTDPQKRHWFVLSFLLYHYLIGLLFRSLRFWSHRKLESRRNANSHLNSASFLLIWRSTRVFIDRIIWLFISREYLQRPKLASQHFLLWSLQTLTFISPSLYSLA